MISEIILFISFAFLGYTSLILIRNLFDFKALKDSQPVLAHSKKVSICIPARNEADNIEKCVTSALKQDYENFEVLVLDDNSTDGTTEILEKLSGIIANLVHIKGKPKPDDWLGKPWACHQLSEHATGDYLIFIDADVWLKEDVLKKTLSELSQFDAITIWPEQVVMTFWEKQVIPLIYFALFTLLPSKYVERTPRWIPKALKPKVAPAFSAACGQFIAFTKSTYQAINGHTSVKQEIVEDVELSKQIKKSGFHLKMLRGTDAVYCRMYRSGSELWNGLRKNFFIGFNRNLPLFALMAFLHLVVFVAPIFLFIIGLAVQSNSLIIGSGLVLMIIFIQRTTVNALFNWEIYSALTHSLGVLWFQALGVRCLVDHFSGKKVQWKNRPLP